VRWVEPSSLRSGSRLEPPHGFSEVADAANINGLADGGWQKIRVVFYSAPVSAEQFEVSHRIARHRKFALHPAIDRVGGNAKHTAKHSGPVS
jgi:hypothetical protein